MFITYRLSSEYHGIYCTNSISNRITGIYWPHTNALYHNKSSHIFHQWHSRFCKMLYQRLGAPRYRTDNMLFDGLQPRTLHTLSYHYHSPTPPPPPHPPSSHRHPHRDSNYLFETVISRLTFTCSTLKRLGQINILPVYLEI